METQTLTKTLPPNTRRKIEQEETWSGLFATALHDAALRSELVADAGRWAVRDNTLNRVSHFTDESEARNARTLLADCIVAPTEFQWREVSR